MGRQRSVSRSGRHVLSSTRRAYCLCAVALAVLLAGGIIMSAASQHQSSRMMTVGGHAGLGHHRNANHIRASVVSSTKNWHRSHKRSWRSKQDPRVDCSDSIRARFGNAGDEDWIDLVSSLLASNPSLSQFYSQDGEDMYLIRHFFSTPPLSGGVFVDVGAMDGVTHSNTKALEEAYEWHGVCIEPSPPNYDKLVQVRPQCRNFNAAVCQEAGRTTIYGEGLGANALPNTNLRGEEFRVGRSVACGPLSAFEQAAGFTHIDLLSVDVGGQEFEVLQSHNWTAVPVLVTIVEMRDDAEVVNRVTRQFLSLQGLCRVAWGVGHASEVFVNRDRFSQPDPMQGWPP